MNHIEIDILRPPAQGYGWSVSCTDESCDDFGDKMLSYEGAKSIAKAHKKAHVKSITILGGSK